MKKILYLLGIITILVIACDKIEGPYYRDDSSIVIPPDVEFPPLDPSTVIRKILVEEYTGHYCTNCPLGHEILERMVADFGESIVPVGIHAGTLASPRPGLYKYNFITETGAQLSTDFVVDGIPKAIINRTRFDGSWLVDKELWPNRVTELQSGFTDVYAGIQIVNKFDEGKNILNTYVKTTMLEDYDEELQLSVFLLEDHVISPQKQPDNSNDTNYNHKHVLRLGVNGTYGSTLSSTGYLEKDSAYTVGYAIDFKDKDWNIRNTSIVAFLHNPVTREVLQVETKKSIE